MGFDIRLLSHITVFWLSMYNLMELKENPPGPNTVLWRITGKDCKQPSYILGTFHLSDAEWLYSYSEIQRAIDSTTFILTEAFSSDSLSYQSIAYENQLKALPLLTDKQFHTLDSFFVARVGEGIKANAEAQNMTVPEMESAILTTLTGQSTAADGFTKLMDLDLFELYKKKRRKGDRLDRVAPLEFDSTNIDHARQYLARSLRYIEGSDKPGWNVYRQSNIGDVLARYKKMEFDYQLDQTAAGMPTSRDFDFVPIHVRNRKWMHKITQTISKEPTLIAVGLGHLYYRTGVIVLLRELGYKVEPVVLHKLK